MAYLSIIAWIILLESRLKSRAEEELGQGKTRPVLGGRIRLRLHRNPGAFLNLMAKKQDLLLLLSCLLTLAIGLVFVLTLFRHGNRSLKLALSLLLGGAFSNTCDRLRRRYVVDYFSFSTPFPALNRIVFNISDFCILAGALLCLFRPGGR